MKQSVTILGVINPSCEQEWILFVRSLRKNGDFYSTSPVQLLKPLVGISEKAYTELTRLGVALLDTPQQQFGTVLAVWLKPETVILKEPDFENLYDHEVAAHCRMPIYDLFWNHKHKNGYHEHVDSQEYLKKYIAGQKTPNYYRHIDTWYVLASSKSWFWSDWEIKTKGVKSEIRQYWDLIEKSEYVHSLLHALSCGDSIAISLVDETGRFEFREPIGTGYEYADKTTDICYYGDIGTVGKITKDEWFTENAKEIRKLLK